MGVIEQIALWIIQVMDLMGYTGLTLMMALESMIAPVPSEIVMPFAGYLVAQGRFSLVGGIVASSLGTIIGSLVGYYMGRLGGYPLILRFGRYLLLDKEHLDFTMKWFERRGDITILISRFIPVVRHMIIPDGSGIRMVSPLLSLRDIQTGSVPSKQRTISSSHGQKIQIPNDIKTNGCSACSPADHEDLSGGV